MATHEEAGEKTRGIESNFVARPASSSLRLSGLTHKISVRQVARANEIYVGLRSAHGHSWGWFQGGRTLFAAMKIRGSPSQRWEHGGAAHVVLWHAGRLAVKAARQLPAHGRDELKSMPPAVAARTHRWRSFENCRGQDEKCE